jgi:hypothetical protein
LVPVLFSSSPEPGPNRVVPDAGSPGTMMPLRGEIAVVFVGDDAGWLLPALDVVAVGSSGGST